MSKLEEVRQLKIKANPADPTFERLEIALEAFEGVRLELIQALKRTRLVGLEDLVSKKVELLSKSAKEIDQEELDKVNAKLDTLLADAEKEAAEEADQIIENMLLSQANIRKLRAAGQL